jgi:hypothetical protein
LQLFVTAVDEGIPMRSSTVEADVRITVTRNQFDPTFFSTPYEITIPESQAVSSTVFSVTVQDADCMVT